MSSVVSRNPYELLGNDAEEPERVPIIPVDKKKTGTKSTGPTEHNAEKKRHGPANYSNDAAFHDKNAGRERNRDRPTGDLAGSERRGGYGARGRGGRGGRFRDDRDDRHSKNQASGSEKQAAQSWGAMEGQAELKDEVAGQWMAQEEQKEDAVEGEGAENTQDAPVEGGAEAEEAEKAPRLVTLDDYRNAQAEKKASLDTPLAIRQANEGSKTDKGWATKVLVHEEEEYAISSAKADKAESRRRPQRAKQVVDIGHTWTEPKAPRGGGRGGGGRGGGGYRGDRGGYRGDRANRDHGDHNNRADRGRGRADRVDRPDREDGGRGSNDRDAKDGAPRGGGRGDQQSFIRGDPSDRAERGSRQGGRGRGHGHDSTTIDTSNERDFPSLGT